MEVSAFLLDQLKKQILEENQHVYNFQVPESLSKNLRTYMSMNTDIKFAIEATRELIILTEKDNLESVTKTALWKSSIVTYGKCFTDASKSSMSKLEAKDCFKNNLELLKTHQTIMEARHGFVAHRSDNNYEKTIVYFQVPKDKILPYTQFGMKSLRAFNHTVDNLEEHMALFRHIETHISKKLKKLFNGTAKAIRERYTKEEIENFLMR
jgi:hypothetical protein